MFDVLIFKIVVLHKMLFKKNFLTNSPGTVYFGMCVIVIIIIIVVVIIY